MDIEQLNISKLCHLSILENTNRFRTVMHTSEARPGICLLLPGLWRVKQVNFSEFQASRGTERDRVSKKPEQIKITLMFLSWDSAHGKSQQMLEVLFVLLLKQWRIKRTFPLGPECLSWGLVG